jgi:membrane protein implicated in regulation of membrane protease activity
MPPIHFRIRTIMIAIAAMAVLMGLLMNGGEAVVMTIAFLVASVLEISAYSSYLSRRRRDRRNSG